MEAATDHRGRPRVVITGMGAVTCCGASLDKTWAALIAGQSGISPIIGFDTKLFDTKFAGECKDFDPTQFLDAKEVRRNDRFIHFALAAADMAMADSGLKIGPEIAERVAVIVGAGLGGINAIEKNHQALLERGPGKINPFFIPALIVNLAPGQISIRFGAKGPSWSPVSACSTSAHAIGESAELIRRGGADVVISGGTEATISPLGVGGFNAMKALSTRNDEPQKASRPWDEDRDGFVMGEGAGILVLESLEHARNRGAKIYAEVNGYGATSDAYHITQPSGEGARRCMVMALADSGIDLSRIGYVNAHGTSTPIGDAQEIEALKDVFKDHAKTLAVSSTKSMHGHCLGAAGAIEAIVSTKTLQTGIIAPTINLDRPSPGCDLNLVPHEAQRKDVSAVLSNSFGFGGTNASVILSRYEGANHRNLV